MVTIHLIGTYNGFHAFFEVTAFLNTFNPGTTLYSAVNLKTVVLLRPSGFDQSGRFTFSNISAGGTFGFTMGGSNFDSSNILQGTLTLNQVTVPEPTSTISLLCARHTRRSFNPQAQTKTIQILRKRNHKSLLKPSIKSDKTPSLIGGVFVICHTKSVE
jgi:hypothetical protein